MAAHSFEGISRVRKINLGGSSSSSTSNAVLDSARSARMAREELRRREKASAVVQKVWRGRVEARRWRAYCAEMWERTGSLPWLTGSLGAGDESRLVRWCQSVQSSGTFFPTSLPPERTFVHLRTLAVRLLLVTTSSPLSPSSPILLSTLVMLMVPSSEPASPNLEVIQSMQRHLMARDMYRHLSHALQIIPITSKTAPALPHLATLLTSPFSTFPSSDPLYTSALLSIVNHILSLPLFLNRLPIPAVTHFSSRFPLPTLLSLQPPEFSSAPVVARDILSNLLALMSPRLASWPGVTVSGWLTWGTSLMTAIGAGGFEPERVVLSSGGELTITQTAADSDDESTVPVVLGPSAGFSQAPPAPRVPAADARTLTRLGNLATPTHLLTLISRTPTASLPALYAYILTLTQVWPEKRDSVLAIVARAGKGGFERELYRVAVRGKWGSFISGSVTVRDWSLSTLWPPLLLLTGLYTQTLLTMGDDEFFSVPNAPRNPFSLDELTDLSGLLLRISFSLYWSESGNEKAMVPGVCVQWDSVRDRVTKLVVAIRARDSRRPFTPPEHWHMLSPSDLPSFVEAAIYEESESGTRSRPLSKRQMALISPRLGVLNNIPFAVPFEVRVGIFRQFVRNDMLALRLYDDHVGRPPRHKAEIRRDHIAEDGYDHLNGLGPLLKGPVAITFRDQWGNFEAGIDGGGVFKEFFTSLTKEAFDVNRGLWLATARQEIYPNPHKYAREFRQLNWYKFMGRILGKALYEGILVDIAFASFFLGKWLGKRSYLDDLASLDPELYNGLIYLKHCDNPEELSLNFTVSDAEFGVTNTVELMKGGSNIPVTKENRLRYIALISSYRLNAQIKAQSDAFLEGLSDIVDLKWLRMFDERELQILVGGVEDEIDLDDLRDNTVYGGPYGEDEETIRLFWKVVKSLDHNQRRALLRFVTSCSRPPLLGFSQLNPKFAIRDATDDQTRLPTSSTCVNLLKLPRYKDEQTLRQKLITAINSNAGFDLS